MAVRAGKRGKKPGYRLPDQIPSFEIPRFDTDYLSDTRLIICLLFISSFKQVAKVVQIVIFFRKIDSWIKFSRL
jgi:hypothetical protein